MPHRALCCCVNFEYGYNVSSIVWAESGCSTAIDSAVSKILSFGVELLHAHNATANIMIYSIFLILVPFDTKVYLSFKKTVKEKRKITSNRMLVHTDICHIAVEIR